MSKARNRKGVPDSPTSPTGCPGHGSTIQATSWREYAQYFAKHGAAGDHHLTTDAAVTDPLAESRAQGHHGVRERGVDALGGTRSGITTR